MPPSADSLSGARTLAAADSIPGMTETRPRICSKIAGTRGLISKTEFPETASIFLTKAPAGG